MMELLLDNGAETSDQDKAGRTAIAFAAANDGIEAMKLLESRGADINKRDSKQRTPLMLAALGDRSESCKLLLKMGAKADVKDIYGEPCIVTMLAKMQTVARIALDQFHRVDGANRAQYFDLCGLEPMEQEGAETNDNKNHKQQEDGKSDKGGLRQSKLSPQYCNNVISGF
ncbi:ankyrin repeat domain-containing protein 7-like [Ptychodera flava]|uniref:ankyrin repeat domain-containing protein 7-like n=1 Tax=Ptychodera flava TaxID=63121 RepID=UPI00396A4A20